MEQSTKHRKMKILLVEDKPVEAKRIIALFVQTDDAETAAAQLYDYEVTVVTSSTKALQRYQEIHPDLVLISTMLKGASGKDICEAIRANEGERHTGIIFIASKVDNTEQLSVECLEIGADDFLRFGGSQREMLARVNAVLRLKAMTDELRSANHRLQLLSNTDELTGLHNMRSFNKGFMGLLRDCRANNSGLGVIMLDLDHFKQVNDNTNHLMGSYVISEVGKLIRLGQILDSADWPARYGGDEFIVAIPAADIEAVRQKGEAIRALIEKAAFMRDGKTIQITTSVGVSWVAPGFKGKDEDPIKAADMMMYQSKKAGRNRVTALVLGDAVDLDHICRTYLSDGDAGSDDDKLPRVDNF